MGVELVGGGDFSRWGFRPCKKVCSIGVPKDPSAIWFQCALSPLLKLSVGREERGRLEKWGREERRRGVSVKLQQRRVVGYWILLGFKPGPYISPTVSSTSLMSI